MKQKQVKIINKLGLHARAAAKFVTLASEFDADIKLTRNNRTVSGKSIMGVMMLAAGKGATINIETSGEDEAEAMQSLLALINDYFGEGE